MWDSESERGGGGSGDGDRGVSSTGSNKQHSLKTDGFERRDQTWFVSSDIPSDLLVKVGDFTFHLHKYPLLARSGRMNRIIYESSRESEPTVIDLDDLPGGAESFELAAKFCYGIAVDLTASNISGLRCAAEYLEMTEDLEEGNLIFKTEAFLSYVVLSSWRDSIVVLKSCEGLSPWAENLQIVRRCSESIAWKACANPKGIRWHYTGRPPKSSSSPAKWHTDSKDNSPSRNQSQAVPPDWWFEDVSILRIDHFVRVVTAIKVKGMRFDLIGAAIMHYAARWLPGLTKEGTGNGGEEVWSHHHHHQGGMHQIVTAGALNKDHDLSTGQVREQRMIIESLISIIPPQRDCVSCSFLLRLLRLANMIKVAPALVTELEKRVGMQLEQAALADLLIPSFDKTETLHDVDLVQRLVEHFLVQEQMEEAASPGRDHAAIYDQANPRAAAGSNAKTRVARLLDSYLTEVARDRNLSLTKFQVLAEALPESARTCDDGLYRAVDSYLKAHSSLTEHERKRLCRVMDCQKLSIDACMHAAQNERLPLRVVVQVLFSEQVKISNALATSSLKDATPTGGGGGVASDFNYRPVAISTRKQLLEGTPQSFQEGWAAAKKDINTLKFELESMKAKYLELQNDMDNLQRQFEKVAAAAPSSLAVEGVAPGKASGKQASPWASGWRKLSKLTRMANDAQEMGPAVLVAGDGGETVEQYKKKGPRRWRNSIS